ncbi:hypothetical protein PWT90_02141 [Aphanocladium album]|nr:hypothetical protein PWT90_02141 [Aphanocladium album]
MRLVEIDYALVRADLDAGVPTNFNTCFHTEQDAPDFPVPTSRPYGFDKWLPLILESRGIDRSACQTAALSRGKVATILSAARSSIQTGTMSRAYAEDLQDEIYPVFAALKYPPEGLFMRLGGCSLKDAASDGQMAVFSANDAVLQISTSLRAFITLTNFLNTDQDSAMLYCVPFDNRMDTRHEYRVFCVPETFEISAVSQYKWHKPWAFADNTPDERRDIAEAILQGIRKVHASIIDRLEAQGVNELDDLIYTQGFSFDVLNIAGGDSFLLVELNSFGVRGACGSCLFQWIRDQETLYNKDGPVEFRVTIWVGDDQRTPAVRAAPRATASKPPSSVASPDLMRRGTRMSNLGIVTREVRPLCNVAKTFILHRGLRPGSAFHKSNNRRPRNKRPTQAPPRAPAHVVLVLTMLFPEEDAAQLKTWIVKRIENTSDADSDVLADYVIALLKHDGDQAAVRKLCEEEIPDFLTEDSKAFLDDVFQAITYKSYMPGAPPAPKLPAAGAPTAPASLPPKPANPRKRGFHEDGDSQDYNGFEQLDERAYKQPRRGGRRNEGFNGYAPPMMGNMPPFDPNNPMEAFARMQAMGMQFPGMPGYRGQGPGNRQRKRKRCRDFDNKGYCARGSTCQYDHSQEQDVPLDYDTGDRYMDMAQMMASGPQFMGDAQRGGRGGRGGRKNRGGKAGKSSKASISADGPVYDRSMSTIVIENIPEESFSEEQVYDFFAQFGKIEKVSTQEHKHLAIVKYSNWDEASAAYKSPKVIFDNRFVKVFWYKEEADRAGQRGSRSAGQGAREGFSGGDDGGQTPEIDPEEFQRRQDEAQKLHQERESKRSELEVKRQELEKQQQELLAKHRAETEKLQAKLLAKTGGGTGDGVTDENGTPSGSTDMLRAKLALLEQEAKILGIDPQNPNGEDNDAGSFRGGYRGRGYRGRGGSTRGGYAPRGRGSFRGNGARHAAYAQFSIDNRPKKIAIAGVDFSATEKDEALRHFLISNGEFESVESNAGKTMVSFPDRKTAEKFYFSLQGKELPGVSGNLELSWVNTPLPPVPTGAAASAAASSANKTAVEAEGVLEDFGGMEDGGNEYAGADSSRQDEPRREVNMDYEMPDEEAW